MRSTFPWKSISIFVIDLSFNFINQGRILFFVEWQAMQEHAAVFREGPSMKEGCRKIDTMYKEMDDLKV